MNVVSRAAGLVLSVLVLAAVPPVSSSSASAATVAPEAERAAVTSGKYVGVLYADGDEPAEGWDITFTVRQKAGHSVVNGWGRSVVFYCYPGPIPVMTPFHVPRADINGKGKVTKTFGTPEGVSGVLRLKFKGDRVTGSLKYTVGSCSMDKRIKMQLQR
jgi:hypothetical protein